MVSGSGEVAKAEYGPMEALAGVLSSGSGSAGVGAGILSGNPAMDAALGDLTTWLQMCVSSLQSASSATSAQVRSSMGRFGRADS